MMALLDGPAGIIKSPTSAESYTWSSDGDTLLAVTRCFSPQGALYNWDLETDRVSRFMPAVDLPFPGHPAYSPDGNFLAFQATVEDNTDIYILDLASGEIQQLTIHPTQDTKPTWSPDGTQLAFVTGRDGNAEIYVMARDGSNKRNLTNHPARDDWPHWSPSVGQ